MPSTERFYTFVSVFVIVIVIFDLDATIATFWRLKNLGYLIHREGGQKLDGLLYTLHL